MLAGVFVSLRHSRETYFNEGKVNFIKNNDIILYVLFFQTSVRRCDSARGRRECRRDPDG